MKKFYGNLGLQVKYTYAPNDCKYCIYCKSNFSSDSIPKALNLIGTAYERMSNLIENSTTRMNEITTAMQKVIMKLHCISYINFCFTFVVLERFKGTYANSKMLF